MILVLKYSLMTTNQTFGYLRGYQITDCRSQRFEFCIGFKDVFNKIGGQLNSLSCLNAHNQLYTGTHYVSDYAA